MFLMMIIYGFLMMFFSLILLILSLMFFNLQYFLFLEWLIYSYMSMKFSFIIYLDFMSLMFLGVVLLISSMVMIYSINYMEGELNIKRFNYLLIMFILSMMFMIVSPSILSILLGWDGLGLISYCLVIFYQSKMAYNSGLLTILLNRLGDVGLLMLICMSSMNGSFNLFIYDMNMVMLILLILSSFTKSAQIPFSSWLPAAMMAPTPISSLVHSSTLVTAGVYLLIRYNYLLVNLMMNNFILLISSMTMFMAGLIANFEYDFKKIIALSTLSQLGLMISILSLGYLNLSFFHLVIHALFKSMMFMSVGGLIHLIDSQDIRKYGNLMILCPFIILMMLISNLCLCGFPFLAGFYSKDLIMEILFVSKMSNFSVIMLIFATIFTVSYTFRLVIFILFGSTNYLGIKKIFESLEVNYSMVILSLILIFWGKYMLNLMYFYEVIMNLNLKIFIFELMFLGLIMGYKTCWIVILNLNYLGYFFSSMFYLNYFFKINYILPLKFILSYEKIIEKGYYESFFGLFFLKMLGLYKNVLKGDLLMIVMFNLELIGVILLMS